MSGLFQPNVCRLCSLVRDKLLPIFDASGSKVDLKIKECLPSLNIAQGDGKPQQICLDCITKVNLHHEFLQICLQSECLFESYIQACRTRSKPTLETEEPPASDGLIVFSKLDAGPSNNEGSLRDLVVVVELKYKDETPSKSVSTAKPLEAPVDDVSLMSKFTDKDIIDLIEKQTMIAQSSLMQKPPPVPPVPSSTPASYFKFDEDKTEYQCCLCQKRFKKRTRLNNHMACHTEIRPHKCDLCDKSFAMRWDLNVHLKLHSREFACKVCDKAFSTKSKLERHDRVHTKEKPFACAECGKAFSEKRNLQNHERVHTGVRPYSCAVCSKTFVVRSHMVEHLNVHKMTPSYICAVCKKSFRWRTNYKRHLRLHKP